MPGRLFRKRRGTIWTAAAEKPPQADGVVDLFADDEEDALKDAPEAAPEWRTALPDGTAETFPIGTFPSETGSEETNADEVQYTETHDTQTTDESLWLFDEHPAGKPQKDEKRARRIGNLILIAAIIVFAAFAFFTLRVEKIEVDGNDQIDGETIIKTAGLEYGKSMFFLRRHSYEDKLREHPYIASAKIELSFPHTVRVTVKERREAAVILGLGTVAVIDEDGYVLSIGQRASYEGLVKIYGVGAGGYQVSGHIGDSDDYASHALTALITAVKESHVQAMIESADLSNTLSVTLLAKSGVTINLGTAEDLQSKLQKLAIVMPELTKMGYSEGTLFIYSHGSPIYSPPSTPPPVEETTDEDEPEDDSEYTVIPSDKSESLSTPSPVPEPSPKLSGAQE